MTKAGNVNRWSGTSSMQLELFPLGPRVRRDVPVEHDGVEWWLFARGRMVPVRELPAMRRVEEIKHRLLCGSETE